MGKQLIIWPRGGGYERDGEVERSAVAISLQRRFQGSNCSEFRALLLRELFSEDSIACCVLGGDGNEES